MADDLASCLRAWRDRAQPPMTAPPRQSSRRAPGLRREELAESAGISVAYLMRLEQGRASGPSLSVVSALAKALGLNATESAHLHRLTDHAEGSAGDAMRRMTASVRRLIARFDDVPVVVIDPAWTIVAANAMARAFLTDDVVGQNAARKNFVGPPWVMRDIEEQARFDRDLVSDLRLQVARHPHDPALREVVADLRKASERFRALWAEPPANASAATRKTFLHPKAGSITVDCDVLEVVGSDLRVVVWTAVPGSADARALASLAVTDRRA